MQRALFFGVAAPRRKRPSAPRYPDARRRTPSSFSNARSTASLRNVPPCTTMCRPSSCGAGAADDLVKRVLNDRRWTGRRKYPSHRRAVLLRLLDGGIHEHRAAANRDRPACAPHRAQLGRNPRSYSPARWRTSARNEPQPEEQASLRKMLSIDAVVNLEALDILPADIDDEIDVRHEMRARR